MGTFRLALVSMPWPLANRPSIQLATLKSFLREKASEVEIDCYHPYLQVGNLLGIPAYNNIAERTWMAEAIYGYLLNPKKRAEILDLVRKEHASRTKKAPPDLKTISSQIHRLHQGHHFDLEWSSYDLVGFSICLSQLTSSLYMIRQIRARHPSCRIVVGGSSCAGELGYSLLANLPEIDFVVSGEGELPLLELINRIKKDELEGDELWQRVDVEPSGTPFNSLVQLEYEKGIPRNPFINAGAIVICDVLLDHLVDPKQDLLAFIREMSGNPNIEYNDKVAESEMTTGYRNRSLINLMKSFGNINHDINNVLDFYFHSCAIEITCKELAQTFLFLACNGVNRLTNEQTVSASRSKRINALMQTCGFYDEAGEFSFCVGLPGKSGVGGGIVAIHPGKYSVGVWSPGLNKKGNSYRGMKVLESLTTSTQSSIF